MENLINKIGILEAKIDNGTATMEEEARFHKLYELAEKFIYSK